jgi:hypothetical protein
MTETAELDTKQEAAPSQNGHDEAWKSFDTDDALLQHIIAKEPAEELVEVPEWECQSLVQSALCRSAYQGGLVSVRCQNETHKLCAVHPPCRDERLL